MTDLSKSVSTLRISGDDLNPSEITALLGAEPDVARIKGQEVQLKSGRTRIAFTGQWHLYSQDTQPANFDAQVKEVLSKLTNDISVWQNINERFSIDIFVGLFMQESNEVLEIRPETLKSLGERGIIIGFDIYGPDESA